jgi:hypothetical protein
MRAQLLLCFVIGTCWLGVQAIPDPKFFLIETKGTYIFTPYIKGSVVRDGFIFSRKFTVIGSILCPLFGIRLNFMRMPPPNALIFFRRIRRREIK